MWKIRRNRKNSAKKIILLKILHLNFDMLIYVLKMCLWPGTDEIFIRMRDKVSSPHSHGIRYIGRAAPFWKKIARKKSWDAQRDSDENENETELNQPERTPYSWKRSASAACNGKMCKRAHFSTFSRSSRSHLGPRKKTSGPEAHERFENLKKFERGARRGLC